MSELFRLCRDLVDIHAVRDWCQARSVVFRVLSGPLSNFHDLAANDATTALLINVITAVGQFQRDLQNELTSEGVAAAETKGRYRGRPPALDGDRREDVRAAFHEGTSIAALARAHGEDQRELLPQPLGVRAVSGDRQIRPDELPLHVSQLRAPSKMAYRINPSHKGRSHRLIMIRYTP